MTVNGFVIPADFVPTLEMAMSVRPPAAVDPFDDQLMDLVLDLEFMDP